MPTKAQLKLEDVFIWQEKIDELLENYKIILFSFPDPFIENLFIKNLKPIIKLNHYCADEITTDWLQNELLTPSLFSMGERGNYFIGRSEILKKDIVDFIGKIDSSKLEHNLLLSFKGGDKVLTKIMKSMSEALEVKINLPKFWEGSKALEFISIAMDLTLSSSIITYLTDTLEFSIQEYYEALTKIKIHSEAYEVDVSIELCKEILGRSKVDQFLLSDQFSRYEKNTFYKTLSAMPMDFEWFRFFCSFMQGHLFKILDPSYTSSKKNLTQYDRKILNYSRSWSKEDLLLEMRRFGKWEIMAKQKNSFLQHELKLLSFK